MFYELQHIGSNDYMKVETGTDFSFPAHLHQCFEIIVIKSGSMDVTVDGRTRTLFCGEAMMIFPNRIHSLASVKSKHVLCIFSPQLVSAYSKRVAGKVPENCVFKPGEYLVNAMEKLSQSSPIEEKKGALYLLCAAFDAHAQYVSSAGKNEKPLFGVFEFVEREYAGECTLRGASSATGYDYAYLSRLFKRTVGITFNEYVNIYRLSRACYLMENTDFPVTRCALESGYASLQNFNRNFKAHYGMTPVRYRQTAYN